MYNYNLGNFRQQYPNLNCDELIQYQYIPTLVEVLKEFHSTTLIVLVFGVVLTLSVILIFIEEVIKLRTKSRLLTYLVTISVLAVFPVACFCFLLTILIPRTHDVNTTFITLFQPLSLVLFYKLITTYFGGENQLREILIGQRIPFEGIFPLSYISNLIPTYFMSRNVYYLTKAFIHQLFLAPCLLYFIMGITAKVGFYTAGQFSFENAHMYIISLGFISVCLGLYTLGIFTQMTQNVSNQDLRLNSKYNWIQSYFVLTRCHVLIFDTLGNNNIGLPCILPYISPFTVAIYIRSTLMIVQSLILSLIARHLFLKDLPENILNEQYLTSNESPNNLIKPGNLENGGIT